MDAASIVMSNVTEAKTTSTAIGKDAQDDAHVAAPSASSSTSSAPTASSMSDTDTDAVAGSFVKDMDETFFKVILAWQESKPYPFYDELTGLYHTEDQTDDAEITVDGTKYVCISQITEKEEVFDSSSGETKTVQYFTLTMPQLRAPLIPEALRAPVVDIATLKAYMPKTQHAVGDFFKLQTFTCTCGPITTQPTPAGGGGGATIPTIALVCTPTDSEVLVRFVLKYEPVM